MKFELAKDVLLDGLLQVTNVVSTRSSLPVLSNVLLVASEGQLRLSATDLDLGITCVIPAIVTTPGAVTLPGKKLFSVIRELPNASVMFSVDDNNTASIRCERALFKLLGLAANEFPDFPDFQESSSFTLPQSMMRESLIRTEYAISKDEARYVLNGVYMNFANGKMTLVATDGRRLALAEQALANPFDTAIGVIIPSKTASELKRLLTENGDITIKFSENQACFEFGDTRLISKIIDGNYPNYEQVIPRERKERVMIPREDFLEIVRRVSLLLTDKVNQIKISFAPNELRVESTATSLGEANEPFPIDYSGREMSICFNPEFILDPLRNLKCDVIAFDLIDEMSPCLMRIDGEFLYVLMPMRLNK